jgi:nitroreductase
MDFFDVVLNQRACREFAERDVRDPAQRSAVAGLTARAWREGGRAYSEGRLSPAFFKAVDYGAEHGMAGAPVIVVVCGDAAIAGMESTLPASVYLATQNLLLAANALGLGSAMTTLATIFADELSAVLDLPESVRPMAVTPLGYPARPLGPPRRLPLSERTHLDRYGNPWGD